MKWERGGFLEKGRGGGVHDNFVNLSNQGILWKDLGIIRNEEGILRNEILNQGKEGGGGGGGDVKKMKF